MTEQEMQAKIEQVAKTINEQIAKLQAKGGRADDFDKGEYSAYQEVLAMFKLAGVVR